MGILSTLTGLKADHAAIKKLMTEARTMNLLQSVTRNRRRGHGRACQRERERVGVIDQYAPCCLCD